MIDFYLLFDFSFSVSRMPYFCLPAMKLLTCRSLTTMQRLLLFFLFMPGLAKAQLGGSYTYQYLQLPVSARSAALGTWNVSTADEDLSMAWYNPAVLNDSMHNRLHINHALRAGNVNSGLVAYGRKLDDRPVNTWAGLMYNTYGQMPAFDETGQQTGTFSASEFALVSGISYTAGNLRYGTNIRLLFGQLENYHSLGLAMDIGAHYHLDEKRLDAGLVLRNIGAQLTSYTPSGREELPFEIQAGISKKLAYLPLRITLTGHNLERFDIRYDDPSNASATIFQLDSNQAEKTYFGDKLLRHLVLSGEFYFGRNFRARVGYDYMQQKEMVLTTYRGLTGFSLGFGFQINKYAVDYGYEIASVSGGNHFLTISADLDEFLR